MKKIHFLLTAWLILNLYGCAFKRVYRHKNIKYVDQPGFTKFTETQLSVYAPSKANELHNVLIFIHGGNWNSGNKSLYGFFGNRLARKGIVAVIINYPLSPEAAYNDMAMASAMAVKWARLHIGDYGGDPQRIFVSGHSAGGHLAALITVNNDYFDTLQISNPLKGAILIDAAGLDMYGYLKEQKFPVGHTYLRTFSQNPEIWKQASPIYHLHASMPPMLIFRGEKTYPSIRSSNEKFIKAYKIYRPETIYLVEKGKKHVPMITQFFRTGNPRYKDMIEFMKK